MDNQLPLIYSEHGHHSWQGPIRFPLFIEPYKHWPTSGGPLITRCRISHESLSRNTPVWSSSSFSCLHKPTFHQTQHFTFASLVKGGPSGSGVCLTMGSNMLMSSTSTELLSSTLESTRDGWEVASELQSTPNPAVWWSMTCWLVSSFWPFLCTSP